MRALVIFVLLGATTDAAARTSEEAVVQLLSGYEYVADRAALEAQTPNPVAVLKKLMSSPGISVTIRRRALSALGHFPTLEVRGILHRLAHDGQQVEGVRHRAVSALGFGFGPAAVGALRPLLRVSDHRLVLTVTHTLLQTGGNAGRQAVLEAVSWQKHPLIRARMKALLNPSLGTQGALR